MYVTNYPWLDLSLMVLVNVAPTYKPEPVSKIILLNHLITRSVITWCYIGWNDDKCEIQITLK